jgi:hypothetical protein
MNVMCVMSEMNTELAFYGALVTSEPHPHAAGAELPLGSEESNKDREA